MGSRQRRRRGHRSSGGHGTIRRTRARQGGLLGGLRGGFKGIVGQGPRRRPESTLSRWLSYVLLAAALALLIYRLRR